MEHAERFFPMSVEARGLSGPYEDELPTRAWLFLGVDGTDRGERSADGEAGQDRP